VFSQVLTLFTTPVIYLAFDRVAHRQTVLSALQAVEDNLFAQSLVAQEAEMLQAALPAFLHAEAIKVPGRYC